MSNNDHANLPYAPRRQKSIRPDRPLPPPPSTTADEEDIATTDDFEQAQGFTSPPSPPPVPVKDLPPPPRQGSTRSVKPPVPKTKSSSGTASTPQTSAAHLHPYHSTYPSGETVPPTTLTPLRAHYLKKTLVNLQLGHELNLLTDPVLGGNALGLLGDPFVLPEHLRQDAISRVAQADGTVAPPSNSRQPIGDLPFIRFMFHQFLLPFPFLSSAPPTFWSAKVQPFLSSFLSTTGVSSRGPTLSQADQDTANSLLTKEELKEANERRKLWTKIEKHLALMFGVGIKVQGGEEVVRIGQAELRRLEAVQEERRRKFAETKSQGDEAGGGFEVNVVGVRLVVEKGRVRHRSHEEFLIRTRRNGVSDVFVSRRYGDFKRLADELRMAFPDYPLPPPPPKDKTVTAAPVAATASYGYSAYNPLRVIYGNGPAPPSPSSSTTNSAGTSSPNPTSEHAPESVPLSRERNRLTLRAYLTTILSLPYVLNSPILRSFLLSAPTTLTPPEALDTQRRLEADAVREEGRRRFREEAERRVEVLREGLAQFKGDVLGTQGGLKGVFEVVRRVEKVEDLPKAEASVLEWGRISLAATIFQIFVASDTASETLQSLKRLHGLMPYFVLKGILKISNPMAMIRGVLDLFLARPFGGQSLIQRMFSQSLTEDVRLLAEDIEAVNEKVDDPVLCQKIEHYANAPFEIQEIYRRDALAEGLDLLVVILRSPEVPSLSRPQFQRVFRASRAYKEYKHAQAEIDDSDDDLGPENDDAWLFEDLNILMKLWGRKKEKEQLLALIFEGVTAELLKDIITIFYTPLAQVYKAASIADSLGDLQAFLNDMIRTVEQVEELSQEDPQRTVQTFIDLVQRHEQAFYSFVHNVHSKGQGLFDSLMGWIELFLTYARDGLGTTVDLDFILPHSGPEREAIMREVDGVAQYHYKLKVAHEEKIRRRFTTKDANSEEEAALLDSVKASLNIGETAVGEAGEIADEESEEGSEDEENDNELADDPEGSETSSIRPTIISPTPELPPSNLLSPNTAAGSSTSTKDRRGSSSSTNRSSIDKIRSSLDFTRKSEPSSPKLGAAPTPPPVQPRRSPVGGHGHGGHKKSRKTKARQAAQAELMIQPETKAIAELRPLFVEIIRPSLVLRRIQP